MSVEVIISNLAVVAWVVICAGAVFVNSVLWWIYDDRDSFVENLDHQERLEVQQLRIQTLENVVRLRGRTILWAIGFLAGVAQSIQRSSNPATLPLTLAGWIVTIFFIVGGGMSALYCREELRNLKRRAALQNEMDSRRAAAGDLDPPPAPGDQQP